uniref:Uncharacterized protein n=1 Tax=Rhizophora mucronata TaxID=61149 RepID=A0A2P2QFV6_RHIMU
MSSMENALGSDWNGAIYAHCAASNCPDYI